jgi:hypothetical protein
MDQGLEQRRLTMSNPVVQLPTRLERIAERIKAAYDRIEHVATEWVEGSVELAAALQEGRKAMPANIGFGEWLDLSGLSFIDKNDRAVLIEMDDHALLRKVLIDTESTSYRVIYQEYKRRLPKPGKTRGRKPTMKQTGTKHTHRAVRRRIKLEDEMPRITGTSLDSPKEQDALIEIKDHYPKIAAELVTRAAAGEAVSARATLDDRRAAPAPGLSDFTDTWIKHSQNLVRLWTRASPDMRREFIRYLEEHADE